MTPEKAIVVGTDRSAWSDEKIASVLTYVRQSFGNSASAITPAQVSAIHAKEADRKEWTQDELLRLP